MTRVFLHEAADDENNYEVDVRLKHEDLELRRVPIAVGHMGLAAPPKAGDLVLVQFLNGDLNQPVITGRFYHDGERPPLHHADEIVFEQRVPDGTPNHLRLTADGTIYIQRDVTKPEDNSQAKTSIKIDGATGNIEIKINQTNIQITDKGIQMKDSTGNLIEMKDNAFKITAKVPFTINASGQPVVIVGKTIDFNKG